MDKVKGETVFGNTDANQGLCFPLALVRIRVNGLEQSEGNRLEK